ncbi:MAG: ATP-binding protein [Bacteroidota bacterium]
MKVTPKILILCLIFAIISVALVKYQVESQRKMINLYIDQVTEQKKLMVRSLIEIQGDYYRTLVFDYTYGDDMVKFAKAPDYKWAEVNLRVIIDFYRANAIWIFDSLGKKVYTSVEPARDDIIDLPVLTPRAKTFLEQNKYLLGNIRTSAGMMEIHGSTIHATNDKKRSSKPQGFVFIGKLWDSAYIGRLEQSSECKLSVHFHKPMEESMGKSRIFVVPLKNTYDDKQSAAFLKVVINLKQIGEIGNYFDQQFFLFSAATLLGFIIIAWLLLKWIVFPLRKISAMLEKQNLPIGIEPDPAGNEFKEITFMINDAIEQGNALKISEEKFRKLMESTAAAIFIHDGEKVSFINPTTEKFLGYSLKELQLVSISEIIHPDSLILFQKSSENIKTDVNNIWRNELRFIRKDGQVRWADVTSTIIEMENTSAFLVTAHDINDRVNMEHELVSAKEHAEQSDKLKAAFLANLSHEIRTPMNSIVGFSNLIRKESISKADIEEYAEIIGYSTSRLLRMIDDILEISKIETNQVKFNETSFSLHLLLEEMTDYCNEEKIRLEKSGLNIELSLPADGASPEIVADQSRVRQVLTNLLDNALKFTQTGTIRFGYSLGKDRFCEFFISDTGIGISIENQEDIFKNFYQVDYSDARKYGGTGLGLSIAKSLIERMGGSIWLKSSKGKGTIFYFTLPFKFQKELSPRTESKPRQLDFQGLTVLIVEDEMINARLMGAMLQAMNAKTRYAYNGLAALESMTQFPDIGLVLMDIQMPGMDGYECTRRIKQKFPHIPVIAQSASSHHDETKKCSEAGCDDQLTKPISAKTLYQTIYKYWGNTKK